MQTSMIGALFCLMLCAVAVATPVRAQPPAASAQQVAQPVMRPDPAAKTDPVLEAKFDALQKQVEFFQGFTESILATVYFALGTIVVVLFAMIGFGWYQNFRAFERDKESLRITLSETLQQELTTRATALEKTLTARNQEMEKNMEHAIREVHHRISSVDLYAHTEIFGTQRLVMPGEGQIDLLHFLMIIGRYVNHVEADEISHALGSVLSWVEAQKKLPTTIRTPILNRLEGLPKECKPVADRIREAVARLPVDR